jgi:cysteine sulfinate desulfinase/cysteine desulfurase-like protein
MDVEPSNILLASVKTENQADSSVRFGVGRFTADSDIDAAIVSVGYQIVKFSSL